MIPQRSLRAKRAKAALFRECNDIDVFVEDTSRGTEKLYSILISKAFNDKYKINNIYQLGGKLEVAHAWSTRNTNLKRKQLFIIDADFSLYGVENTRHPYNVSGDGFFVLKRFSIESYLIDERAAIKFLNDEDLDKDEFEIERSLKFTKWLKNNQYQLSRLFMHMATVRAIDESISIKRWKYTDIIISGDGLVCKTKIKNICDLLKNETFKKSSKTEFRKTYSLIRSNFQNREFDLTKYICAKDFLFMLLILRMKKVTNFREKTILLKQKIASRLDGVSLNNEFNDAI